MPTLFTQFEKPESAGGSRKKGLRERIRALLDSCKPSATTEQPRLNVPALFGKPRQMPPQCPNLPGCNCPVRANQKRDCAREVNR